MSACVYYPTAERAWEADPWGTQANQTAFWTSSRPVRDSVSKYNIIGTQKDDSLVCLYTCVYTNTHT